MNVKAVLDAYEQRRPVGLGPSVAGATPIRHERRAWTAAAVNLLAMGVEIGGGVLFGSAALLAEGYHMGAHVTAMAVAGIGYRLSAAMRAHRREDASRHVGVMASLVNALILLGIAGLLVVESIEHLARPAPIPFVAAVSLAIFGLIVNVISLVLLRDRHDLGSTHHRDLSFQALYLHMIGDTGVGLLSIFGLCLVSGLHWLWADGAAGLCGAALILALAVQILMSLRSGRRSRSSE